MTFLANFPCTYAIFVQVSPMAVVSDDFFTMSGRSWVPRLMETCQADDCDGVSFSAPGDMCFYVTCCPVMSDFVL